MLDHHQRIAMIGQFVKHFHKFTCILKMKTCGWFIENIEGFSRGAFRQFFRQFDTLRFATGKGRRLLPDLDIA